MDDKEILGQVQQLVDEEHGLRARVVAGEISVEEERQRLQHLETTLDQCWDLLRQRRALREAKGDPDQAKLRPTGEVEGYLQ